MEKRKTRGIVFGVYYTTFGAFSQKISDPFDYPAELKRVGCISDGEEGRAPGWYAVDSRRRSSMPTGNAVRQKPAIANDAAAAKEALVSG